MKTQTFRLETGDRNAGTVYLPDHVEGRIPVLVYCHGWGGSQKLPPVIEQLRPRLEARGAAVLTFDFYGCGETGGDYSGMTYGRWHRNLADIFAWLAAQPWADMTRAGGFAISSGTTALLRFAAGPTPPAYAISTATAIGAFIGMPNAPARLLVKNLDDLTHGKRVDVFNTSFDLEFFRDFIEDAPVYTLKNITCPVFFLQGGRDNVWRRTDAWLGYLLLKDKGAKYLELETGDHGLDTAAEQGASEALAWLETIGAVDRERA